MKMPMVFGGKLKLVNESQLKEIHQTGLDILSQVGVQVLSKEVLDLCHAKGATIIDGSVVRMPKELVEWAISTAPNYILLAGRSEECDLHLEKNRVYLGTGGAAINIYQVETGTTRPAKLSDLASIARLCDALDHIHFFIRPIDPPELSPEELDVHKFYVCFANTRKHVMGAVYSKESARKVIEMASTIAGGIEALRERPFVSFISASISPLRFDTKAVEVLLEIIKMGLPVSLPSVPVAGSTGPASLAGLTALAHAEALASVVIAQLAQPRAPVLYAPIPRPVNWRTMGVVKGGVESGMMNAILAQMSHYIGIPQYADAGGTEAKQPDIQSSYEATANIMLVALAGGNYIHHAAGLLDSDITACLEKYVIDDDICGMIVRALKGLEINLDRLAFNVVKEVGPKGNFLTHEHTLSNLRSGEIFTPFTACRNESLNAIDKATKRVRDILAKGYPDILDKEMDQRIQDTFSLKFNKSGLPL